MSTTGYRVWKSNTVLQFRSRSIQLSDHVSQTGLCLRINMHNNRTVRQQYSNDQNTVIAKIQQRQKVVAQSTTKISITITSTTLWNGTLLAINQMPHLTIYNSKSPPWLLSQYTSPGPHNFPNVTMHQTVFNPHWILEFLNILRGPLGFFLVFSPCPSSARVYDAFSFSCLRQCNFKNVKRSYTNVKCNF